MPSSDRSKIDTLSEDIAIIKNELVYIRKDMNKMLHIILESDPSLVSRVTVNENNIEELQKSQWESRTAIGGAVLGIIMNVLFWLVTKK